MRQWLYPWWAHTSIFWILPQNNFRGVAMTLFEGVFRKSERRGIGALPGLGNILEKLTKIKGTRQGQWKQHWQWLL